MTNKTDIGKIGEAMAVEYLQKRGYRILHRNYRIGHLEIDIICENETHLLFVEVKSRTDFGGTSRYGRPSAAVDEKKRAHLLAAAESYLRTYQENKKPRIDVVEVYLSRYGGMYMLSPKGIHHIENAVWGG